MMVLCASPEMPWTSFCPRTDAEQWSGSPITLATSFCSETSTRGRTQVAALLRRLAKRGHLRLTVAPLERKPSELRALWACIELGLEPWPAFKGRWDLLPEGSQARLLAHMNAQAKPPLRERIAFAPESSLNRGGLERLVARAHKCGHRLVIVDPLHHMDHGDGPESRGIRDTMKLAKRLAQGLDLAILFTAQLNRGHKG